MNASSSSGPTLSTPSFPSHVISRTISFPCGEIGPLTLPPSIPAPLSLATQNLTLPHNRKNNPTLIARAPLLPLSVAPGMAAGCPCPPPNVKKQTKTPHTVRRPYMRQSTTASQLVSLQVGPTSLLTAPPHVHMRPGLQALSLPHPRSCPLRRIFGQSSSHLT